MCHDALDRQLRGAAEEYWICLVLHFHSGSFFLLNVLVENRLHSFYRMIHVAAVAVAAAGTGMFLSFSR